MPTWTSELQKSRGRVVDKMRRLQNKTGLSNEELGRIMRVSPSCVSNWNNGKHLPVHRQMEPMKGAIRHMVGIVERMATANEDAKEARSNGESEEVQPSQVVETQIAQRADFDGGMSVVYDRRTAIVTLPHAEKLIFLGARFDSKTGTVVVSIEMDH